MRMSVRSLFVVFGTLILAAASARAAAEPVGSAFSYQGFLTDAGGPVNGAVDLKTRLYDADVGGIQSGGEVLASATVTEGQFSVDLDFGAVPFSQNIALWLEIEVSDDGGASWDLLSGRQRLTPVPFAMQSQNSDTASTALAADFATLAQDSDNTRGLFVDAGGNIGIGTTTPNFWLTLDQPGHGFSHLWDAGGGAGESDITTFVTGNGGWIGTRNPKPLYLYTNDSAPRVTLDTLGNLGVGTQSPAARLDVRDFTLGGTGVSVTQTGQGNTIGVNAAVSNGVGVRGEAITNSGTNFGVLGVAPSTGWGVFSQGRIGATGTKSFVIDHPLDPANKVLLHYSSEAPEPLNTYSGTVLLDGNGRATVGLPDYFESINTDYRYQLTAIGGAGPNLHVATEIANNRFSVAGGSPGLKVSWEVTARRNDAFVRLKGSPRELLKSPENRGKYLLPEAYNAPASKGINAVEILSDN
ncbi:MAG: hypothetical protein ACI89L_001655 [Phycisphaerales bacterium]|jgi:hypothetical protein